MQCSSRPSVARDGSFFPLLTFFDHVHCRNPETGPEAGDWITRERDYANQMFIVVRGSAAVKDGNDAVLRFKAGLAEAETLNPMGMLNS